MTITSVHHPTMDLINVVKPLGTCLPTSNECINLCRLKPVLPYFPHYLYSGILLRTNLKNQWWFWICYLYHKEKTHFWAGALLLVVLSVSFILFTMAIVTKYPDLVDLQLVSEHGQSVESSILIIWVSNTASENIRII